MKLIICNNSCLNQVIKFLINNYYYYMVFEIKDGPEKFLSLLCPEEYSVINKYEDDFFEKEDKIFLKGESYEIAFYIKLSILQTAIKIREDARIKRIYSNILYFLPIKNSHSAFKLHNYAFIKQDKNLQRTALIIACEGYGDSILVLVLIRAWIETIKIKNLKLTVYHMYQASYHLSQLFLPDCQNAIYPLTDELIFIEDASQRIELEKLKESDIIQISHSLICSAYTKMKELADILCVEYNNSLLDFRLPFLAISENIKAKLKLLKQQKDFIIGVQFFTCHENITFVKRSYSAEMAQKFIDLCRKNNIGVINLSEYCNYQLDTDLDLSHLTINELFTIVDQIDMITGIDSSCGHIAGALKKKNLVLLGRVIHNSSQRPYSMNYTIVSEAGDINMIAPEDVYKVTVKILTEQIVLNPDVQKVYDYTFDMEYL